MALTSLTWGILPHPWLCSRKTIEGQASFQPQLDRCCSCRCLQTQPWTQLCLSMDLVVLGLQSQFPAGFFIGWTMKGPCGPSKAHSQRPWASLLPFCPSCWSAFGRRGTGEVSGCQGLQGATMGLCACPHV